MRRLLCAFGRHDWFREAMREPDGSTSWSRSAFCIRCRRSNHAPLYTERKAIAAMGPVRLAVHRVLRAVYFHTPLCDVPPVRRLWRAYRWTWPA
jgi:hypothetical protein